MASVSWRRTSTRRCCPFTTSVIRRSTEPGADACPSSGRLPRNRYAVEEATAPPAMTPLMKLRRVSDIRVTLLSFVERSLAEAGRRGRGAVSLSMILKQFYLNCLAHASYLIGDESSGIAAVVDPQRDVDGYLVFAAEHGLRI